jgi:hypothetical protein
MEEIGKLCAKFTYLEINSKYFVYEYLCQVWLNFSILFEKMLFLEGELPLNLMQNYG